MKIGEIRTRLLFVCVGMLLSIGFSIEMKAFLTDGFEFGFNQDGKTLYLARYHGEEEDVRIPAYAMNNVGVPMKVTRVIREAFYENDFIRSLHIPETIPEFPYDAIYDCKNIAEITVDEENPYFSSSGGVLFNKDFSTLLICPPGKKGDYEIPSTVQIIEHHAFYNCSELTSITIPESVQMIEHHAFYNCSELISITIPESVTEIGEYAFEGCASITEIDIPNSVVDFPTDALNYCSSLKRIGFPNSINDNEIYGLCGCSSLEELTIPSTITRLAYGCCNFCLSLKKIFIPKEVVSIYPASFGGCKNLTEIIIDEENPIYKGVEGMIVEKETNKLIRYPSVSGEVVIPEGIESVGINAFYGCDISILQFPASTREIDYNLFCDMPHYGPKEIRCWAQTPPKVSTKFFVSFDPDVQNRWTVDVYVPGSAVNTYRNTFPWSYYKIHPIPGTEEESGIDTVDTSDTESFEVFNLNGVLVLKTGNKEDLQTLPKGIYIVNGQKVVR